MKVYDWASWRPLQPYMVMTQPYMVMAMKMTRKVINKNINKQKEISDKKLTYLFYLTLITNLWLILIRFQCKFNNDNNTMIINLVFLSSTYSVFCFYSSYFIRETLIHNYVSSFYFNKFQYRQKSFTNDINANVVFLSLLNAKVVE